MKMTFSLLAALALTTVSAAPAFAGDAAAGAQKAAVCGACHGATGSSVNPEWPNLAGQHESYIVAQLQQFKQATRDNPLMMPNAAVLSEQDMQDLGAHFASQAPAGLEADPSNYRAGEKLYRGGDTERRLPACIACHGPQGKGNGPARYPALRAQHSVYTYNQLKAFAEGRRRSPGNDIMQVIAARLTDEEMRAIASYTQGLR
ncbi:MAG: c-type cytochrome [Steroidobacteraceae bacterium]